MKIIIENLHDQIHIENDSLDNDNFVCIQYAGKDKAHPDFEVPLTELYVACQAFMKLREERTKRENQMIVEC